MQSQSVPEPQKCLHPLGRWLATWQGQHKGHLESNLIHNNGLDRAEWLQHTKCIGMVCVYIYIYICVEYDTRMYIIKPQVSKNGAAIFKLIAEVPLSLCLHEAA